MAKPHSASVREGGLRRYSRELPLTGAVFDGVVTAFDERREFIRRQNATVFDG